MEKIDYLKENTNLISIFIKIFLTTEKKIKFKTDKKIIKFKKNI